MSRRVNSSNSGRAKEEKAKVRGCVELYTLEIAEKTAAEAKEHKNANDFGREMLSAMTTVVFSQIAIEGFFHSLLEQQLKLKGKECEYQMLQKMARLDERIEMGVCLISGKKIERGKQPLQDFELLRRIRNTIVHYTPTWETSEEDDPVAILEKIRTTKRFRLDETRARWEEKLFTAECAQWAYRTALEMICYVHKLCDVPCPKPVIEKIEKLDGG